MIELLSVAKTYGDGASRVEALREIDLHVPAGQFVSIMGPSGSGKSTLLNLVCALDVPSAGSIRIAGHEIARMADDELTVFRRRSIGLIFQFFNLLPTLSALDNVLLPVSLERHPRTADTRRACELLQRVGLAARTEHFMDQLSGGEMQRVAIARALMMQPSLILADEPTGNLDSQSGASILALLRQLSDETGTTIVMVTHDPAAALSGERVLWLRDGRIERDEQPRAKAAE